MKENLESKIQDAIDIAIRFGGNDGSHHKDWVIDQMVRILAGPENYKQIVQGCRDAGYDWEEGIPP